jgi:hypothetical protein
MLVMFKSALEKKNWNLVEMFRFVFDSDIIESCKSMDWKSMETMLTKSWDSFVVPRMFVIDGKKRTSGLNGLHVLLCRQLCADIYTKSYRSVTNHFGNTLGVLHDNVLSSSKLRAFHTLEGKLLCRSELYSILVKRTVNVKSSALSSEHQATIKVIAEVDKDGCAEALRKAGLSSQTIEDIKPLETDLQPNEDGIEGEDLTKCDDGDSNYDSSDDLDYDPDRRRAKAGPDTDSGAEAEPEAKPVTKKDIALALISDDNDLGIEWRSDYSGSDDSDTDDSEEYDSEDSDATDDELDDITPESVKRDLEILNNNRVDPFAEQRAIREADVNHMSDSESRKRKRKDDGAPKRNVRICQMTVTTTRKYMEDVGKYDD